MIAYERRFQLDLPPQLSADQEVALNTARQKGDADAREQLILANMRLVFHLARRYNWCGIAENDLSSAGTQGLIRAVDTYDHSRGRLAAHAGIHIRKEIFELIAEQRTVMRLPPSVNYSAILMARAETALENKLLRAPTAEEVAEFSGLSLRRVKNLRTALGAVVSFDRQNDSDGDSVPSLSDTLADANAPIAHQEAEKKSRAEWLRKALGQLTQREQSVLIRHFGLDGTGGVTLAEIAGEYGLSRERIRQVEAAALRKLRRYLHINAASQGESVNGGWDSLLRSLGIHHQEAAVA